MTAMGGRLPHLLRLALENLSARRARLARRAGLGRALAALGLGLFLLGWCDLLADLPGGVRLSGMLLVLAGAAAAAGALLLAAARERAAGRLAGAIDRHARTGGLVLAGLELAEAAPSYADETTRSLAESAALEAGRVAAEHDPMRIAPAGPARRPWLAAAAVGGAHLLVAVLWPGVFVSQALRLLDPLGDHPPYSPYTFEVAPGDARVFFGDPFTIQVTARGETLPERAEWVLERDASLAVEPLLDRGGGSFTGTVGAVESPFSYHVRGPQGRSRRFRVEVVVAPRIDRVEARVEPPAYTRLPPFEGPYPEKGIAGVKGTRVRLGAVSNRPLAWGTLEWKAVGEAEAEPPLELASADSGDPNRVEGGFEITADRRFELTVRDREGNASREPFPGKVTLIPDRRPGVTILEPPPESYATPDAAVPVVLEADDDFGLSRAEVFRSLNGTRDHPAPLELPEGDRRLVRLSSSLPLGEWGLEPGDVLEVHAAVSDNDPDGPKSAESKVHRLRIISREEFERLVKQMQGIDDILERYGPVEEAMEEAREALEKLRRALEKEMAAAPGSPEAREAARESEEARESFERALAQAARSAREGAARPPIFDIDRPLGESLERLSRDLARLEEKSKQAMPPAGDRSPRSIKSSLEALDELARELGAERQELQEEVAMPLDVLEKVYRLLENEARFTALALEEDDLARRTRRFGDREKVEDPDERADMRLLAEEQRALEDELREVLQGIRDSAARLPEGEDFQDLRQQAEEFATKVVEAKAPEALARAGRALADRAGREGAAGTREAADLLLSFVKRCRAMGGSGRSTCMSFQPKLSESMGGTLDDLLAGLGLPTPGQGTSAGPGMLGQGGGSSAARSPGSVGLYGPFPARGGGGPSANRRGEGGRGAQALAGGEAGEEGKAEPVTDLLYGGVPLEAVPAEYRAAVREFFRTVAEESGRDER
jgi:hypothetical protein